MNRLLASRVETPIGAMRMMAREGVLLLLEFEDTGERIARQMAARFPEAQILERDDPFDFVSRLSAYFAGDFHSLDDIISDGGGTAFETAVWRLLRTIPVGETWSYGQLAAALGSPGASRAVGRANALNPIAIVVPCHRVIGADGTMTGYGGGLARKEWLLAHERALLV
jgi:methylated-DNA-[protein]-cysteine S-methyltransferase